MKRHGDVRRIPRRAFDRFVIFASVDGMFKDIEIRPVRQAKIGHEKNRTAIGIAVVDRRLSFREKTFVRGANDDIY